MARVLTQLELLQELEPVAEANLNRHLAMAKDWHPHDYEILSGQLVAPGIPGPVEHELMEQKVNSYGKTWHVWRTGAHGQDADPLPFGEARLAWSFNRDGEARPELVAERDRRLGIDTASAEASGRREVGQG